MSPASPPGALTSEADGLPQPRRFWSALTIWLAIAMAVLDGAIVNVALPSIATELSIDPADAIWIVNAYQLAIIVALLPLASLGDKVGYHRVYVVGLSVFTLGSLGCALSQSLEQLVVARVVQGLGGAGLMSINAALVRFTYPQAMLGRGIARNAVVVSMSAALGPTFASAILAAGPWQWLFAINVPVGIVTILVALRTLPRARGTAAPLDFPSALLNCIAFGGLILGAESFARTGSTVGLIELAVGGVGAALLVRRSLHVPTPLMPIDLLKIRIFRLSILTSVASFTAQMMAFVALPFHLQGVAGRSAVETGLLMTPWPLAVALMAPVAGRLSDRHAAGTLGAIGLAIFSLGLGLLAMMPANASDADILWRMVVCGLGFGFFQSPNNRTIVSAAPRHRSGAAGGMLATGRLLGLTTGALGMAVLFHSYPSHATGAGLAISAAVAAGAAALSLLRIRQMPTG